MPEFRFEPSQHADSNTVGISGHRLASHVLADHSRPQTYASFDDSPVAWHDLLPPPPYTLFTSADCYGGQTRVADQHSYKDHAHVPDAASLGDCDFQYTFDFSLRDACASDILSFPSMQEAAPTFDSAATRTQPPWFPAYSTEHMPILWTQPHVLVEKPLRAAKGPVAALGTKHRRKQIMSRSRNGCWICRIKHLKCDERRPSCDNCTRFGIDCDFSEVRPAYVADHELRREKLNSIAKKRHHGSVRRML